MGRPRIYEENDRFNKTTCGCGQIYTKTNKSHHIKTNIHKMYEVLTKTHLLELEKIRADFKIRAVYQAEMEYQLQRNSD
jgi:hypothetical protein